MPVSPNRIPTQRQLLDKACAAEARLNRLVRLISPDWQWSTLVNGWAGQFWYRVMFDGTRAR